MRKIGIAIICLLVFSLTANAQKHSESLPIEASLFNNGNFMPGGGTLGVWSPKIHPGIRIGSRYYYLEKEKWELFQTAKLGYFFHRHAQQAVQLYTELGYRHAVYKNLFAEARLGVGYMVSVPDMQLFSFDNGEYRSKSTKARSQFMGGVDIALGYDLKTLTQLPLDVYLSYQFWVQSPFVNGYVPVLPNNSIHIGAIYYLPKNTKNKK